MLMFARLSLELLGIMNQDTLILIPARLESTRLDHKLLQEVDGKPLIWHTWKAASETARALNVSVITDCGEIYEAVIDCGGKAQHRSGKFRNGTQRVFGYADEWSSVHNTHDKLRWLVNWQGDEPQLTPPMVDVAIEAAARGHAGIGTLAVNFRSDKQRANRNEVKVATDRHGRALYFTRQPIPASRRHAGLYAFSWPPGAGNPETCPESTTGRAEALEQLDWMEAGMAINVAVVDANPIAINTRIDLENFRRAVSNGKATTEEATR